MYRLRDGRFQAITPRDGLPNSVDGLLDDGKGDFWGSSNQGVVRFSLKELYDFTDGRTSSISAVAYGTAEGMRNSQCNGPVSKTRDGRLWFPTVRGVVAIDPTAGNRLPPPVVIEEALANKVTLGRDGRTSIPPGNNTFDFRFTALSLSAPEKQRFKYRLDPYDKDWVDAGAGRTAHYTNMAPGEYSFRVIAANSYGVWNNQGASVRFVLQPHFYQTNWFYALCAIFFLALLWMAHQFHLRQLQRALKRLRDVIETIPAMAWTALPDGSNAFVNRRWAEYTGLSAEETAGSGWTAAVHPEDRQPYAEKWRASVATGEPVEFEARFRCAANGEYRWFLGRGVPLRDPHGKILRWYGILTDIEDRKRAEQTLRESETRFRTLVDHAADAIFVYDFEQRTIFDVNPQACEGLGYTRQELVGTDALAFHPDLDRAAMESVAERAAAGETVFDRHWHRRKDGTVFPVEVHTSLYWYGGRRFLLKMARDISDRLRAEEAVRQSEKQLRDVIDTIPAYVWSALPDGSVDFVNQRCLEFTGHSFEQSLGRGWEATVHPEDCGHFLEEMSAALASGEPIEAEARMRRADGQYRWQLFRGVPLRDETGKIVKWYGTNTDIDDRKHAEQSLRRSEAYLADAQRLTHTGSYANDGVSRKGLYWSDELFRLFGFDPQQGLPARDELLQRIHPEDRDKAKQASDRTYLEKLDCDFEFRVMLPDGTVKHVHSLARPVLSPNGDVAEVVGTNVDITERKRAEETLRESETRFRTFVDHATDAFFLIGDQGKVLDVNRQACGSLGYTREELIGMTARDFDPDADDAFLQWLGDRLNAGVVCTFETRHRRKDETVFPVEVRVRPFWQGSRRLSLALARDITDRRRAEEERERLRQLEADLAHINRVSMMGELAASIAHEVNQPLSGIVSNGSACLRWLAGDPPNVEEVREAVRDIVRDGKRAGEVIARIRALTKRTSPPGEKLDVNETIREVLAIAGDEAKRKSVVIRTQFADDLSPVSGDRVQLQQVVLNLIMNGMEAMSSVGERARQLAISTRNIDPDQVQVTVEDSGVGLDPNTIGRIFDPFYTTKPGGMGMGLSISRSILQNHGGRLWATGNDGPGTTFQFTLPKYHAGASDARVA